MHQYTPQYNSNGIGGITSTLQNYFKGSPDSTLGFHDSYYGTNNYRSQSDNPYNNNGVVKFNDNSDVDTVAYQGYSEYRNKIVNFTSEL